MADVKVPVGITPEGVVIDVHLDAAKYELVRRAIRHEAFTEAEQAIRAERDRYGRRSLSWSLLDAARDIVADLREGRAVVTTDPSGRTAGEDTTPQGRWVGGRPGNAAPMPAAPTATPAARRPNLVDRAHRALDFLGNQLAEAMKERRGGLCGAGTSRRTADVRNAATWGAALRTRAIDALIALASLRPSPPHPTDWYTAESRKHDAQARTDIQRELRRRKEGHVQLYTPDYDWLMTPTGGHLHHATLSRKYAERVEDEGGIYDQPIVFDCGEGAITAWIPGLLHRQGMPRCPGCCEKTGLPGGMGSPKNDAVCRRLLGLDS